MMIAATNDGGQKAFSSRKEAEEEEEEVFELLNTYHSLCCSHRPSPSVIPPLTIVKDSLSPRAEFLEEVL